jgi:hypothetical protein
MRCREIGFIVGCILAFITVFPVAFFDLTASSSAGYGAPFDASLSRPNGVCRKLARLDLAEEGNVPRGTGLGPSRSSVVSQKKQR